MSQDTNQPAPLHSQVSAQHQSDATTEKAGSAEPVQSTKDGHVGTESAAAVAAAKPQIEPNHNQTFLRDI